MNTDTLHDDISYLRKLAESGRKGPILGGVFLAGAGVVFGIAALVNGAADIGWIPLRGDGLLYLWLGASVVFALFWIVMFSRLRGRPQAEGANTSTMVFGTTWSACGAGVMVCFLCTLIVARMTGVQVVLTAYIPVIFAFYGTAWFISAALAKRGWMVIAAIAAYAFAFVIALLTYSAAQTFVMGGALFVLLTVPGLRLAADETRQA